MQNIDSDLIRGNIDTIILKTMLNEDKYGLDIIKEVSDKSSGTYELKQPTLYSCLKRLENQELISSYWVDSEIGGKRHYYKLTDKGRDFYNKKQEEWARSKFIIDNLLSNYNYEEYRLVKKDEFDDMLEQKANAPLYKDEQAEDSQTEDEQIAGESEDEYPKIIDHIEPDYSSDTDENEDEQDESAFGEAQEEQDDEQNIINYSDDDSQDEDFETQEPLNLNDEVYSIGDDEINENNMDDEELESDEDEQNASSDDDYPVYFETKQANNENANDNNVSYETSDQSMNELNFLSRLHAQEDEEINTYYGDQKSYVNHLNQLDESQLEQQDLLDSSLYVDPDEVNKSINEFSDAVERLNSFNSYSENAEETQESEEAEFENEEFSDETSDFNPEPQNSYADESDEDDDLDELKTLSSNSSSSFFNSDDSAVYGEQVNYKNNNFDDYEPETNAMSFDEITREIEKDKDEFIIEKPEENYSENVFEEPDDNVFENPDENVFEEPENNFSDIDKIISNNISANYAEPATYAFYKSQSSPNYREKLSDLSKYSKVSLDDEKQLDNEEGIEKAKDIAEITKELEEEGIRVKEHYKQTSGKKLDKNYLLANKINLMKSLIMFFGYVFILSAVYIVLNNTDVGKNSCFSFTPFLIGFIPFAAFLIYYTTLFVISPYKKIDAKYHFRIMLFISIIVTIQLLLITYCVNLQLGFYSFTQKEYNHLYWIIPSIISFAPIIDNLVYLALFNSKNFNV